MIPSEAKDSWNNFVERHNNILIDHQHQFKEHGIIVIDSSLDSITSWDDNDTADERRRELKRDKHKQNKKESKEQSKKDNYVSWPSWRQKELEKEEKKDMKEEKEKAKKDRKKAKKERKHIIEELLSDPGIQEDTMHGLMIDAGSTGSRMHVYEFKKRVLEGEREIADAVSVSQVFHFPMCFTGIIRVGTQMYSYSQSYESFSIFRGEN